MSEPMQDRTASGESLLDNRLFGARPVNGCGVCTALDKELGEAWERGDDMKALRVAAEIRNPRGHR
jgi:hypothetical protein